MDLNYKPRNIGVLTGLSVRGLEHKFEKAAKTGKPVFMYLLGSRWLSPEGYYAMPDGTVEINLRPTLKAELKRDLKMKKYLEENPQPPVREEDIPF